MSKTKKKRSYTEEFKTSVLQKLEEPNNTITSLSDELGVPRPTIYQWIKKAEADNMKVSINHRYKKGKITVKEINQGIEQINNVVQSNAVTFEKCVAFSQEISSEAESLREMIRKFKVAE